MEKVQKGSNLSICFGSLKREISHTTTTYYETITGPNKRNPIWEAKAHVSFKLGHNKIPKEVGIRTGKTIYQM